MLLAVGARLLLDPGTNRYYIAGLVVGTLIWDAIGSRWHLPWWTATAYGIGRAVHRCRPLPALRTPALG